MGFGGGNGWQQGVILLDPLLELKGISRSSQFSLDHVLFLKELVRL